MSGLEVLGAVAAALQLTTTVLQGVQYLKGEWEKYKSAGAQISELKPVYRVYKRN